MKFLKSLRKLNDAVYSASNGHSLVYNAGELGGYFIIQVQEKDAAGWTLIHLIDGPVVGIINWQACGICIYTNDYRLANVFLKYRNLDMYTGQQSFKDFNLPEEEFDSLVRKIKALAFDY